MAVTFGRVRLRIHPLAMMFPVAAAMLGAGGDVAALALGLMAHEGAHLLAARGLGVGVSQLRLMPFGGTIAMENAYALAPSKLFAVAAAGPLGSALAIVIGAALAHWGLVSPGFSGVLLRVNLTLLLFNLIPALPLDGGRMLYASLCPRLGRERAVNIGIRAGRAVALALVGIVIWAALEGHPVNLSFLFAAVFILASGPDERSALSEVPVSTVLSQLRPVLRPRPARIWAVGAECEVRAALRVARPDAVTLYAIYDGSRLASVSDDRRLLKVALDRGPGAKVAEATARRPLPGRAS